MSEEQKYSVVGRVEIGTDEYRDLIEKSITLEKELSEYRSKYWAEQTKSKDNISRVALLEAKVNEFNSFITDSELERKFKEYRISKLDEKNEED
jgi:hypothetical protein